MRKEVLAKMGWAGAAAVCVAAMAWIGSGPSRVEEPTVSTEGPASGTEEPAPVIDEPAPGTAQPASGTEELASGTEEQAPGAVEPAPGIEEPAPDLQATVETLNVHFAANRLDSMSPHFARDITLFGPSATSLIEGKDRLVDELRDYMEVKSTTRLQARDWHIQLYGNVGIVSFIFEHDGFEDGRPFERVRKATYVFHLVDGRWLQVHDHTSAMPVAGAPLGADP